MDVLLTMSIIWICYGILGIFGIQNIPKEYKQTEYEKDYKRFSGIGWLLLGVPYFIIWVVARSMDISDKTVIILLVVFLVPSLVYSYFGEKKFRKRFDK